MDGTCLGHERVRVGGRLRGGVEAQAAAFRRDAERGLRLEVEVLLPACWLLCGLCVCGCMSKRKRGILQ